MNAKNYFQKIILVYGERCYRDRDSLFRDIDRIIQERGAESQEYKPEKEKMEGEKMEGTKLYANKDANLSKLDGKTIAVIGYGNQGRSQALNLRDTIGDKKLNTSVIIGNREDENKEQAKRDGFEVYAISEACEKADIMLILIPDEVIPGVYNEDIEPHLKKGNVIDFASGYCITCKLIEPPKGVDVIMVAPRMGGKEVRELYKSGEGFPNLFAVGQDASGEAKEITLALSSTIGLGKSQSSIAIEVTFEQETLSDLLSEQFLSPLILAAIMVKYEIDVENGIPPEAALMELYLSGEWAEIFKRMAEMGIFKQLPLHSQTSQYGQLAKFNELMRRDIGLSYKQIKAYGREKAEKIKNGAFAREWALEKLGGYIVLKKMYEQNENCPIIKEEQKLLRRLGR